MFDHLFSTLCFSLNVITACLMELQIGMTIEQLNGTPWDLVSILKLIFLNSCIDLHLSWKPHIYLNTILLNLKMFLCVDDLFFFFFLSAITKDIVLFKTYFKSSIYSKQNTVVLRFEIVSDIKLSV